MKRIGLLIILVAAASLTGCTDLFPPVNPEPPPTPELMLTATAEINDFCVTVSGCVEGGTPPYTVIHECDAGEICAPGCPVCPSAEQVPCPPTPDDRCCFEFVCCYDDAGTYTIVVSVQDSNGLLAWVELPVTITLPPIVSYTITASAGEGGSISPSGTVSVTAGDNQTFTIRVFDGYTLGDVLVDGVSVLDDLSSTAPAQIEDGTVYYFTFEDVQADHTIQALFGIVMPPPPPEE